jgi:lysophospholipase L1-like esterase
MTAPVIPSMLTTPPTTPNRGDRATFAARSFALDEFNRTTRTTEFNTLQTQAYTNATAAYEAALTATSAPPIAPAWVSGQTYVVGYPVYSVLSKLVYRRVISGAGATDPSLDAANWSPSALPFAPANHTYGGQLAKLRESLNNPFEQITGICLIGDSITWGRTLPDNAASTPRSGALTDPRDDFTSSSWANKFKRHIGAMYFENTTPVLTNVAGALSGQAVATYSKNIDLFTMGGGFTYTVLAGSVFTSRSATAGALLGYRHTVLLNDTESAAIDFTFTGSSFTLYYTCLATLNTNASYELIVDGISQGNFNTADGVPNTNQNSFTHSFGYVRNKVVRLRVFWNAGGAASQNLNIEGIRIPKKVVITNQGIIGTTSRLYGTTMLPAALATYDNFAFVMLGTNDRIKTASPALADMPNDQLSFRGHLSNVRTQLVALADVVFMCANPATEDASTYCFTQQVAKSVIEKIAKENSHDFIDNYSIFSNTPSTTFTADGLHPNALGMGMIAENIIAALEQA